MVSPSGRAGAVASVALGALILGFAPIGLRLSELGPQATALWRFVFAIPALALYCALAERRLGPPTRRLGGLLAIAGIAFGLDIAFWHAALLRTSVVNATLFSNMTPIMAALAGWLFLKERITGGFLAGAGVAALGALALSVSRAQGGQGALDGDLMALTTAVWYAAYLVMLRFVRRDVGAGVAMLWSTIGALGLALIAVSAFGEALWPHTPRAWAILIGLGVIVHAGGQGLIANGVGRLPIALSTVLLWLQPLSAAALSWILFGEALLPLGLLGAALLLTGVWIVQTRGRA